MPEADRPLLCPCSSPSLPLPPTHWAATAPAPMSPTGKATTYPSYSVLFYSIGQILSSPSALSPPAWGPGSGALPTHLARAAPVQSDVRLSKGKTTTSLSIFFNHEPKNNLIFKTSKFTSHSCFWHHCF